MKKRKTSLTINVTQCFLLSLGAYSMIEAPPFPHGLPPPGMIVPMPPMVPIGRGPPPGPWLQEVRYLFMQ